MTEYTYPCPNCSKEIMTMDEFHLQSCDCIHKLMAEKKQLLVACKTALVLANNINDCVKGVSVDEAFILKLKAAIAAAEGE